MARGGGLRLALRSLSYRGWDRLTRPTRTRPQSILAQPPAHRFIDQGLQRQLNPPALFGGLYHEDDEHVVLRVHEIERAAGGVPAIFAQRPGRIRRRRGAHGKAEPKTAARSREIERVVQDPGLRPDMIRR